MSFYIYSREMKYIEISIKLLNAKKRYTRMILVSSTMSVVKLHEMIQRLYGLSNYHLRDMQSKDLKNPFTIKTKKDIQEYEQDFCPFDISKNMKTAEKLKVRDILNENCRKIVYTYDFWANNERELTFKWEWETTEELPKCVAFEWPYILEDEPIWMLEDWIEIFENQNKKAFREKNNEYWYYNSRLDFVCHLEEVFEPISCGILTAKMRDEYNAWQLV